MGRLLDLDDFLDPKSLTPQELYRLQSETWAQGAEYEQERIIKLLETGSCGHYCRCMNNELCDVYAEAIALIKGENK